MQKNILMPALSPTMEEGNLVKWLKKEGDKISDGEVIAEIETDKATMEVEASDDGVLAKILVPEGTEAVKVNTPIAVMVGEGESLSSETPAPSSAEAPKAEGPKTECSKTACPASGASLPETSSGCSGDRILATPLAKRIAQQKGISLSDVKGSGPYNRIIKADIEAYKPAGGQNFEGRHTTCHQYDASGRPEYDLIKLSSMRKTIAKRLVESKHTSPHFYVSVDCEIDDLLAARKKINESLGIKLTVNDFIIKAVAKALISVPKANSAWADDGVHQFSTADVAVAVAIEDGLITPIIHSAENKGLAQISAEIKELAARAKEGKLKPEEFTGGTFTISNMGMYGISTFSAIINPPHAGIIAIGGGVKKPVVHGDSIEIATIMTCTLSVDHRVIDGAVSAQFLAEFKRNIETPTMMLV